MISFFLTKEWQHTRSHQFIINALKIEYEKIVLVYIYQHG